MEPAPTRRTHIKTPRTTDGRARPLDQPQQSPHAGCPHRGGPRPARARSQRRASKRMGHRVGSLQPAGCDAKVCGSQWKLCRISSKLSCKIRRSLAGKCSYWPAPTCSDASYTVYLHRYARQRELPSTPCMPYWCRSTCGPGWRCLLVVSIRDAVSSRALTISAKSGLSPCWTRHERHIHREVDLGTEEPRIWRALLKA